MGVSRRCRRSRSRVIILLTLLAIALLCYRYINKDYYARTYLYIVGEAVFPEPTQRQIDYLASNVYLNYTVDDNFPEGTNTFKASLTFINTGNDVMPKSRWQLYGNFFMLIEPGAYPYERGLYIYGCGLKIFHIDGNLYRFEPVGNIFQTVPRRSYVKCEFQAILHQISKTDSMPRWYFTGNNLIPKIVKNTDDEKLRFVTDFTHEKQYASRRYNSSKPYTPQDRYRLYKRREVEPVKLNILPTPLFIETSDNAFMTFNVDKFVIIKNDAFQDEITNFAESLGIEIVRSRPTRKYIIITKSPVDDAITATVKSSNFVSEEAYILESSPNNDVIKITSASPRGVFYAFQTLVGLLFINEVQSDGVPAILPNFRILDAPRYPYRGVHIDVARNFFDVEEILKIIDVISMYKMNKLHLHLTDDEGWRLEIPGLPELTQIGGHRCHDPEEQECLIPLLGSGPYSNTSGSGFYDVEDYKEILNYAKDKHVDIIPEFDMPGHSRAAIKSIYAKEQRSHRRKMNVNLYSILDDNDKSVFKSGQNFKNNAMNPCVESTYDFVRKVMVSVKALHQDIQPLTFYHFGGDEVANGAWSKSPACKDLMAKEPGLSTEYDLMKYFMNKVMTIGSKEGLSIGAWEDAMLSHKSYSQQEIDYGVPFPRNAFKNDDVYVYVWKRPVEKRTPHRTKLLANAGYKVILACGSYLYFDHPYEPDPEERGLYWATRKISTYDAWSFTQNTIFKDKDEECPEDITDKKSCYQLQKPENIMGIQAELWTETVRTDEHLEYMLFPRLLAVAERAWHKALWEDDVTSGAENRKARDWSIFANKLGYRELRRLDQMDIKYRVSPPGAMIQNEKVAFNTEFPGQDIEYYVPDSRSWHEASHGMHIDRPIWIRGKSEDGSRFSREVLLDPQRHTSASVSSRTISLVLFVCMTIHMV